MLTSFLSSPRQTSRCPIDSPCRALHTERTLLFPGRSSLSCDNPDIGSICRNSPNHQGPSVDQRSPGSEPTKSNQLLHIILLASGLNNELDGSGAGRRRHCIQIHEHLFRRLPTPPLPTLGIPQRNRLGERVPRLHQHGCHRYVSDSFTAHSTLQPNH